MRIVVLGESAVAFAALVGARSGVSVTVVADPARGWANARALTAASDRVILADLVGAESVDWANLIADVGDRLVLSRRLRFDRTIATARQAIRAGNIGELRSAHLTWSFTSTGGPDPIGLATELVDAALWLLDDLPRAVYAAHCADDGPPFISVNLQTRRGFLALLEATVASAGLPPFRDVSLLGSDGAIYHRSTDDDLLWTTGGADVLSYADDALAREVAVVTSDALDRDDSVARGSVVARNLAIAAALARSLKTGEPVQLGEESQ
jgi:predicted dehydrogenase